MANMCEQDLNVFKKLLMFHGLLSLQNDQGYESFDEVIDEAISVIDELRATSYSGDNMNLQDGVRVLKVWDEGLLLLKQRIKSLRKTT
jgi:hypothetical protein